FEGGALVPASEGVVRSEKDRALRTLALGLAASSAFLPTARNPLVALGLTLLPALVSALVERSPEAEDLPRARFVHRFSPLAVAAVLILTALFPYVARRAAIETALCVQAPLAFFLYVPRVRAIHLLVVGWAALAGVALDD